MRGHQHEPIQYSGEENAARLSDSYGLRSSEDPLGFTCAQEASVAEAEAAFARAAELDRDGSRASARLRMHAHMCQVSLRFKTDPRPKIPDIPTIADFAWLADL